MRHSDWAFFLYSLYVPLLISIYLLELFVIVRRRRQYHSSFYKIFSVRAVMDVLACLVGNFLFRLPLFEVANQFYGELDGSGVWIRTVHTLGYYFNCISQLMGVMLAMNRFTGLFLPQFHDKIWRRALIPGILLSLVISLLLVWSIFGCSVAFFYVQLREAENEYASFYILMVDSALSDDVTLLPQQRTWLIMVVVTVVCNVISFLVYVACLIRLCFFSKMRNFTIERNFFIIGFTSMLFSLPYMATMLYFHLVSTGSLPSTFEDISFVVFQLPWLTDLKYLSPAPILLLTNKCIRKGIRVIFCGNQVKDVVKITIIE